MRSVQIHTEKRSVYVTKPVPGSGQPTKLIVRNNESHHLDRGHPRWTALYPRGPVPNLVRWYSLQVPTTAEPYAAVMGRKLHVVYRHAEMGDGPNVPRCIGYATLPEKDLPLFEISLDAALERGLVSLNSRSGNGTVHDATAFSEYVRRALRDVRTWNPDDTRPWLKPYHWLKPYRSERLDPVSAPASPTAEFFAERLRVIAGRTLEPND